MLTIAIHCSEPHASPSVCRSISTALGVDPSDIVWVQSHTSQLSSGYDGSRAGTPGALYATPIDAVRALAPSRLEEARAGVLVVAYSAGCWLARRWLQRASDQIRGVVVVDGWHARRSAVPLTAADDAAVLAYAQRAAKGDALFVLSHTAIDPRYTGAHSTSETAGKLLDALGAHGRESFSTVMACRLYIPGTVARVGRVAVISCDGANASAHARQLREVAPTMLRAFVRPWLDDLERGSDEGCVDLSTAPTPAPTVERLPLGERCAAWCEREARDHRTPDAARIAWYHAVAVRGGKPLGITAGNHCASAQSRALVECLEPGEAAPHEPRAAARELMTDARAGGRWHPAAEVRSGAWTPRRGDLVIYDRSVAGRPETAWYGHVDRVLEVDATGRRYRCLGANEGPGGAWREEWSPFAGTRLLGFVGVS